MGTPLGSVSKEKPNLNCFLCAWPPVCHLTALLCMLQKKGGLGPEGDSPTEGKGNGKQHENRWIWTAIKPAFSPLLSPPCILIAWFQIISSTFGGNLLVCEYLIWHWLCQYLQPHCHGEILGFFRKRRGDEKGCDMLEPDKSTE